MSSGRGDDRGGVATASLDSVLESISVQIGEPTGDRWIAGTELVGVGAPFEDLLLRIGERAGTDDRKTIAASFVLRFGWASRTAILPWLRERCVPDVSLGNVSFRFRESVTVETTALHTPRGWVVAGDPRAGHPSLDTVPDETALVRTLRAQLVAQATPVVETLRRWSGFGRRGSWGMLTSSWAAHVTGESAFDDQHGALPRLEALFAGTDLAFDMRPEMRVVEHGGAVHLYQTRASCCRYYLLPTGSLCASCPLISEEEQRAKNVAWMDTLIARRAGRAPKGAGHG